MGIKAKFSLNDIKNEMMAFRSRVDKVILLNLQRLGEMAVIHARNRTGEESWFDQTGNLRSSIGYVIGKDGYVLGEGGFSRVLNGAQGCSEGEQYARELAHELAGKYFLIVVAGMNYASYVEEMDNKDVLASSELFVRNELPKMKKRIDTMLKSIK